MVIKSNRGVLEFGLDWLIQLILFGIILMAAAYATSNLLRGGPELANGYAMTLGRKIESAAFTANNVTVLTSCPSDANFSIKGNYIRVGLPHLRSINSGQYYFLYEKGANLPSDFVEEDEVIIDCRGGDYSQILIKRTVIEDTSYAGGFNISLEVSGVDRV